MPDPQLPDTRAPRPPTGGASGRGKLAAAGHGPRVAASSSGAELRSGWAWSLTVMVILAGGVTLYAARAVLGATLDRWLPSQAWRSESQPPAAPAALLTPAPGAHRVIEPAWTYVDLEAAIWPLPERARALIEEGRDEMPQFRGLGAADPARALLIGNRWRLWGRIWHNRVDQVRRPLPPAAACDVHAALEPTCRALRDGLALLDQVPAAGSAGQARDLLDSASAILERLRDSQTDPDAETTLPGSSVP